MQTRKKESSCPKGVWKQSLLLSTRCLPSGGKPVVYAHYNSYMYNFVLLLIIYSQWSVVFLIFEYPRRESLFSGKFASFLTSEKRQYYHLCGKGIISLNNWKGQFLLEYTYVSRTWSSRRFYSNNFRAAL